MGGNSNEVEQYRFNAKVQKFVTWFIVLVAVIVFSTWDHKQNPYYCLTALTACSPLPFLTGNGEGSF